MKDGRPVIVSVKCATYNHAPYIRQCLDGFVMQKTNFRFEVIVHDDASTDGTTEIVREYAEKYPNIIKPMYEEVNQYSRNLSAMNDAINKRLVGKYVAICEGDDYWCDPLKLQKQVDYLESHPKSVLCFHPNYRLFPDGKKKVNAPKNKKDEYNPKDIILGGGGFMATSAMLFLRQYYLMDKDRPDFFKSSPIGDVPLRLFLASKGTIGYIDDVMSVYRKGQGEWTRKNSTIEKRIKVARIQQDVLNKYDKFTEYRYHRYVVEGNVLNWLRCIKLIITILLKKLKL